MNPLSIVTPSWSTASFGDATDTFGGELPALSEHLAHCKALTGRLFTVRCLAEVLHGFVATRLVTTLVVVAALLGVGSLMF